MKACNIKCPHCGKSHYMELGGFRTAGYYPAVYKDGVNVNPDRNISTTTCQCLECYEYFQYKEQQEKIIDVLKYDVKHDVKRR